MYLLEPLLGPGDVAGLHAGVDERAVAHDVGLCNINICVYK